MPEGHLCAKVRGAVIARRRCSPSRFLLGMVLLVPLGCRDAPRTLPAGTSSSESVPTVAAQAKGSLRALPAPVVLEGAPERDPLEALSPPDQPMQRLAFSRGRLAWLAGDELWVYGLDDFAVAAHFRAPDARNVVALTGGGFLVAGRDHVQRLSGAERRPELFPRAPRIGPTTIIASRLESEQFWLYYAGVSRLPRFDLGAAPLVASLPMTDWTELHEFDRRALLGHGDGSFVYTTLDGLRRIDVEGRRERLPHPELAGRIWALAPDARLDRVWAVSEQHLYLVHVRERAQVVRREELAPHAVALAGEAGVVAVLSVEGLQQRAARLRVDVYVGDGPPRVIRFEALAQASHDAGSDSRFEPEIALSEADGLLAVNAFGLHVHDYRRGVRKHPPAAAQKLAPGAH